MSGLQGLTFEQILALLRPNSIWDWLLYVILILIMITLFMQPEGSTGPTILLALVVIAIFMDKVQAFNQFGERHVCSFGAMMLRISFFVLPLIVAGISKNPKSRPPAVIAAVLALGYTLFLWAVQMRNPAVCPPLQRDISMLIDVVRTLIV